MTPQDQAENLVVFAHYLPALMKDGVPLSWRHYIIGSGWIGRHVARVQVREYMASLMSTLEPEDRREWVDTLKTAAGWTR